MDFEERLSLDNIKLYIIKMPTKIRGFVYWSGTSYYIFINNMLSFEGQRMVFFHELGHIKKSCPKRSYIIELDRQYEVEEEAEMFVKEVVERYERKSQAFRL